MRNFFEVVINIGSIVGVMFIVADLGLALYWQGPIVNDWMTTSGLLILAAIGALHVLSDAYFDLTKLLEVKSDER